jgi:HD-like signal output (HDOD) protein/ActR/RegA family two-component response regulator
MKRVLFVDDEPLVLAGLQRMLFNMRRDWDMRFAGGGQEALRMLAEAPADVVVSDMRMPEMNGAQLLNEVMRKHPQAVRFILSGYSDMEMIMQCVSGTHQFLSKPCDGETLRNVVGRALEMDTWLNNDGVKALVSKIKALPSLPSLYFEVMKELGAPEATLDRVGATIAKDPGMTAKILQLVNSAFFGLCRQITDPTEAVLQLGLETIKSLVLGIHVFSELEPAKNGPVSAEALWRHSLATAGTARRIAKLERQEKRIVEESFTSGLLHDIGRLVLLANVPEQYAEVFEDARENKIALVETERTMFGASHAEVGGYLLGLWGLPISLVESAVYHHCPRRCLTKTFTPLTAVHAANVMEQEEATIPGPASRPELDWEYLEELGLAGRAPVWRDTAGGKKQF